MCTLRKIRMRVIRMIMRVTCYHEVCGMCSQEEGPYSYGEIDLINHVWKP